MRYNEITCNDGFRMSVQAGFGLDCEPRGEIMPDRPHLRAYTALEVGYPSDVEPMLGPWCQDTTEPTMCIYSCVPSRVILAVIMKHGGVLFGELPPLSFKLGGADIDSLEGSDSYQRAAMKGGE